MHRDYSQLPKNIIFEVPKIDSFTRMNRRCWYLYTPCYYTGHNTIDKRENHVLRWSRDSWSLHNYYLCSTLISILNRREEEVLHRGRTCRCPLNWKKTNETDPHTASTKIKRVSRLKLGVMNEASGWSS